MQHQLQASCPQVRERILLNRARDADWLFTKCGSDGVILRLGLFELVEQVHDESLLACDTMLRLVRPRYVEPSSVSRYSGRARRSCEKANRCWPGRCHAIRNHESATQAIELDHDPIDVNHGASPTRAGCDSPCLLGRGQHAWASHPPRISGPGWLAPVAGGLSRRAAAERFGVSAASAARWVHACNTTGTLGARPQGGDMRSHHMRPWAP